MSRKRLTPPAFTLVELLVSMAVLSLIMVMLIQVTDATRRTWSQTTGKISQFQEAREGFESMLRRMTQAVLNPYLDYDSLITPTRYLRQSELRFISGPTDELGMPDQPPHPTHGIFFQAPLGFTVDPAYAHMENLLNTWGYFIEWGSDEDSRPPFITTAVSPARWRFRLMELMEPSETLTLYNYTSGSSGGVPNNLNYTGREWFLQPLTATSPKRARVLAENVILLQLAPRNSEGNSAQLTNDRYFYSSAGDAPQPQSVKDRQRNLLPPMVRVTMIAVDEASFARFQSTRGSSMPAWTDGKFTILADQNKDAEALRADLDANRISYREFTSNVPLRAAKWSP